MKLIIFFIYITFVHSELHTFYTFYTELNVQTIAGIPEISSLAMLDGRQIDYYDSEIKKLIPRQDWMKEFFKSGDRFEEYTEIRERVQQTNKMNIHVLMQRFNQSHGVHTYQRMYGCGWDDGESRGFDVHGYDDEEFMSLDVERLTYIAYGPQAAITKLKWYKDGAQLEYLQQYYQHDCVDWLKYFVMLGKADFQRRAPEVSLLQRDPRSPVLCHVTGFYPSAVTIIWFRNGEELDEDVDLGGILPNEDGTFQKTSGLRVAPDEWKKNQYVCEVEHMTETIQKIVTENEIRSNSRLSKTYIKTILVSVMAVSILLYICLSFPSFLS